MSPTFPVMLFPVALETLQSPTLIRKTQHLTQKSRQPSMPRMLTAFQFTAQALRMTIQKGRLPHDWKRWRRAAARPARKSRTGQVWHKWDPVKSWLLTTAQPGSLPRRLSWRAIARLAKATRTPPALSRS
nr:MAG TPA: hypothetical protein [Caudoviricetes sp.]